MQNLQENRLKTEQMTAFLCENLVKTQGVKVYSKPNPCGIVTFNLDGMQSEEVAFRLSEDYGICVRGGLHCAPLMHKALKSEGSFARF